ncbi:MAG: hypothetical protein JO001_21960 [Alphaproteobacteria bacterium]|nr:hypothetical protein [Alphaproteobacteria bacterium]
MSPAQVTRSAAFLQTAGYFGLSHKDARIAHDRRHLTSYVARFKHALLLTPKLVVADHMVINAPNFRRAYHSDVRFREVIQPDFVEVAFFECHKTGEPMSLTDLREFYHFGSSHGRQGKQHFDGMQLFHPKLPRMFQSEAWDSELLEIENVLQRRVPPRGRDNRFTTRASAALEGGKFRSWLEEKKIFSIYRTAFDHLIDHSPTLGIIHFDPHHRFPGDRNIFDYIADLPTVNLSAAELARLFGTEVARAHRAMLVGAETQLLGTQAILPADLADYRTLVLKSAAADLIDNIEREERSIKLDLAAIDTELWASLTSREILDLRRSDPGYQYFEALELDVPFAELARAVDSYTRLINKRLSAKSTAPVRRVQGFVNLVRGLAYGEAGQAIGWGTVVTVIAGGVSHIAHGFNVAPLVKAAADVVADRYARPRSTQPVVKAATESNIIEYATNSLPERLLQYR